MNTIRMFLNINVLFIFATLFSMAYIAMVGNMTDVQYSILFCSYSAFSLFYVWRIRGLTPFLIFLALSNVLFIGGRFWAILINPELSLNAGTFFFNEMISRKHLNETLYYIILFTFFSSLGYSLCKVNSEEREDSSNNERADSFLRNFFWIVLIVAVYGQIQNFVYALSQGSYLAMYEGQTEGYSAGGSLGKIVLYIFFGLAMAYGSDSTRRRYLMLFFIYSIINILIGGRGMFGAVLMFTIWYYSLSHKVNILKLVILVFAALMFLLWVFSFSIRSSNVTVSLSLKETISMFIYSQGLSMAVFDQSRDIMNYPVLPYIQSIIPGSSAIYSLISGVSLKPENTSFASYLSDYLNPTLYARGQGLGWTFLGDLYLFSGRSSVIFSLLALGFGYVTSFVEQKSKTSMFCKVLVFSIFMRFVLLPRTGINTIVPFVVYVYVIHAIFRMFYVTEREC